MGNYQVHKHSGEVVRENKFTTLQKRLLVELPIFILGISVIFLTFLFFDTFTLRTKNNYDVGYYSYVKYQIYTVLLNIAQGLSIVLLNSIYEVFVDRVVEWENHK